MADLHLINTPSGDRKNCLIDTSPEALLEWLLQSRQHFPGAKVAL